MFEKKRKCPSWVSGLTLSVAGLVGCAPQDGEPAWNMADANVDRAGKERPAGTSCALARERASLTLSCAGGAPISTIGFASYGLPTGSCATGMQLNTTCHAGTSRQAVEAACLGKPSCTVSASNAMFGDPCRGKAKTLAVAYSCGEGGGGGAGTSGGTNGGGVTGGGTTGGSPPGNQGTLTVMQGSSNIGQITQFFQLPGHVAPTRRWTQRTSGLCGNSCRNGPRHMYSAAFSDTLLVSWMAVDEADPWKHYGNVATFKVANDGKFTFVDNVSFKGKCEATYGIATNDDGSVIAVLCSAERGETAPLPNTINMLATRRTPASCNGTWEGTCYPIGNYSGQDSALYLLEYTSGRVTQAPTSTVLVNHAVGGWNYGHHELSLNAAGDTYFVHLKVTAGPSATNRHEGLTHFGLRRKPTFEYVRLTDWNGWSCGSGHVTANRMAYNQYQDSWSQLCLLDACPNGSQYANGRCNSISFSTVPGVTKPQTGKYETESLLELDQRSVYEMTGGISTILSLGAEGWLALAAGPGYASANTTPDTVGFLRIPLALTHLRQGAVTDRVPLYQGGTRVGDQEVSKYQWNWLYLPDPDPTLGRTKRVGMAAMGYFNTQRESGQRLLAGWSPSISFQAITPEYVVSEVDRAGRLRGQAYRVSKAGWGEDNRWTTMPSSGCIVFPFAWEGDAPGRDYPIESSTLRATDLPRTLHMTSLCPRGASQHSRPPRLRRPTRSAGHPPRNH